MHHCLSLPLSLCPYGSHTLRLAGPNLAFIMADHFNMLMCVAHGRLTCTSSQR